jgi:hypothetical protein
MTALMRQATPAQISRYPVPALDAMPEDIGARILCRWATPTPDRPKAARHWHWPQRRAEGHTLAEIAGSYALDISTISRVPG